MLIEVDSHKGHFYVKSGKRKIRTTRQVSAYSRKDNRSRKTPAGAWKYKKDGTKRTIKRRKTR